MRFIFIVCLISFSAWGQEPEAWPGSTSRTLWDQVSKLGDSLSQAIFDQFEDINLYSHNFGQSNVDVSIGRRLFDNQDLLNTYTVTDHIKIKLDQTLWSPTLPNGFGFQIGVGGELNITNARQVAASRAAELPRADELREEITGGIIIPRDPSHSWYRRNPQLRPAFSQIWNMATQPLKIPLKREHLSRLKDGELISWSVSGYVSAGPSWNLVPISQIPTQIGVGAEVFLKGEYRITILKESEKFVRLKLTRVRAQGTSVGAGAEVNAEVLEGMVVFGRTMPGIPIKVVPFKFKWTWQTTKQQDMAFRYDLEDPEAAGAFEKAVLGQFSQSSEDTSGVTRILTRSSIERQMLRERGYGLSLIIKGSHSRDVRSLTAWVRTQEGDYQVFKESVQLSNEWSSFWSAKEKINHTFTVALAKKISKEAPRFILSAESNIEDKFTNAKELFGYVSQVEAVVGDPDAIPEIPFAVPRPDGSFSTARFGMATFYYGKNFDADQVERLILTPMNVVKSLVDKAFAKPNVGQSFKKISFLRRFKKTQRIFKSKTDPVVKMRALRKLFEFNGMGDGIMRFLGLALANEETEYFVTATNRSFGRVQARGKKTTDVDRILELADSQIAFERLVGSYHPVPEYSLSDISFTRLESKKAILKFNAPLLAHSFFIRIVRVTPFRKRLVMGELVFRNKDEFNAGNNALLVSEDSPSELGRYLSKYLLEDEDIQISLAMSGDGLGWGPIH
ncbi:MAG: hypothetical protein K2P81_07395 [Bacteriovoracaceae bacterium]|nr:hypothetical protein [Bacteriovoracaceae bacterium]